MRAGSLEMRDVKGEVHPSVSGTGLGESDTAAEGESLRPREPALDKLQATQTRG